MFVNWYLNIKRLEVIWCDILNGLGLNNNGMRHVNVQRNGYRQRQGSNLRGIRMTPQDLFMFGACIRA